MKFIVIALIAWLSLGTFAHASTPNESIYPLSQSDVWRVLTQYEGEPLERAISSSDFYLSETPTPYAELTATLVAMKQPARMDEPDQHPQCRYPARYLWLKQQGWVASIEDLPCPQLQAWMKDGDIDSVSFILATGYFGNPASFYGHTLFKLNGNRDKGHQELLDSAINYGAIIPPGENPLIYIIRGVSGLYDAAFSQKEYYYQNHNYGEGELRDQWEYVLNVSPEAAQLVAAHSWELLRHRFDYYFFTKNCAYRMARLIEVIEGVSILPDRQLMIPQSIFQRMAATDHLGQPLIREVIYHPSRQTRLYQGYADLSREQQALLSRMAVQGEGFNFDQSPDYQALPDSERIAVVDTLLDYQQFRGVGAETKSAGYLAALGERYRLPVRSQRAVTVPDIQPHQGRNPGLARSGWRYRPGDGAAISVMLRPAYYDALDAGAGHIGDSKLVMGELSLSMTRNRLRLEHLDVVALESVNHSATGLPDDAGMTWRLRTGAEQLDFKCHDCLVPFLNGYIGLARPLDGVPVVAGVLAGAGVQDSRAGYGYLMVSALAFANVHLGDHDFRLEIDQRRYGVRHNRWSPRASFEGRWSPGLNSELRYGLGFNETTELSVGYGIYW